MYMIFSRKAETLCIENETYCYNVIILKHLQQAAQTHTKQHIFSGVKGIQRAFCGDVLG